MLVRRRVIDPAARKNQQRPESGGFPCVQEFPEGYGSRRPARRIVDDDLCAGRADDDHVVKPSSPLFEQHDHGPPVAQEIRHALDRSGEADDTPTAIFDGLREDAGGKAARSAIEQRRELIPVVVGEVRVEFIEQADNIVSRSVKREGRTHHIRSTVSLSPFIPTVEIDAILTIGDYISLLLFLTFGFPLFLFLFLPPGLLLCLPMDVLEALITGATTGHRPFWLGEGLRHQHVEVTVAGASREVSSTTR